MNLAADLLRALDPVALAPVVGMEPDPWQAGVLRSSSPRVLLNCARQVGKSTTAALLAVHVAVYEPGSLVLLLSPSQRQSAELYRKGLAFYRALGRPVASEGENALSLALENGSRIVSLPGTEATIRGYSGVRLLIVDEAARVPDELMASVRPMLAVSGGRLVAMSTPWGKRGWWYEAWQHGGSHWDRVRITAAECPRITAAFLEEERRSLGAWWYAQEYACVFAEMVDQLFGTDHVRAAFTAEVRPLFPLPGGAS
ncbi:MAG: terminase family protein [Chloroflexota bacterium]